MKRLLIILVLFTTAMSAKSQVYQLERDNSYIIITDTVTAIAKPYPVSDIYYDKIDSFYALFDDKSGRKVTKPLMWTGFVDSNGAAFASEAALIAWLRTNTRSFSAGGSSSSTTDANSVTGWADYVDTEYTTGSPFVLTSGQKATLPMNGGTIRDLYLPGEIDSLFNRADTAIIGREGDAIAINIEFQVRPTSAATDIRVKTTIDIGGAVGEIYPREQSLTKGNGVEHFYLTTTGAYTLDTWEANGGKIKVEAINGPVEIYNIRVVVFILHHEESANGGTRRAYGFALSSSSGSISTGTNVESFVAPWDARVRDVIVMAGTAPTGSTITVDVNESGSSLFSTPVTIDAGELSSITAAARYVFSDSLIDQGDLISFDIDQVGSSNTGERLKILLELQRR